MHPHPTPASAMPSTFHGTQAPHPHVPSALAAPPTPGDAAATGHPAAVAPGEASAAAVPAVANAAAAPSTAVATALPAVAPPPRPIPPHPPVRQLPPPPAAPPARPGSRHAPSANPQRGDLLLYLPGRPVVVDACVTHPLASSAVAAAAWGTGVSAEAKDALKRDQYGRTGAGACRFVPLTAGQAPQRLRFSMRLQSSLPQLEQPPKTSSWRMRCATFPQRYAAASRGRQLLASAPLRARLDGRPVLPGRPVPTDVLA